METVLIIIAATFFATTAMTLFSYVVSATFRDLYQEPLLLQYVMRKFGVKLPEAWMRVSGWLLHYAVGLLFVVGYAIPLHLDLYKSSWISGFIFGAVAGIIGIISWKFMFRFSGRTPMISPTAYYRQLFVAHLIFGLATVATYRVWQL